MSDFLTLNWEGREKAEIEAEAPAAYKAEAVIALSHQYEKTNNIYIEGDNLEALKILIKSYCNRVKAIYIDPPYNTGRYFVYEDRFSHGSWCTMMFPRLAAARKLLADNGVMFISIGESEIHNLALLCQEIFGEENIETMIWQKVGDGDAGAGRMKQCSRFRVEHEYVLVCCKNKKLVKFKKSFEIPNFKNVYKNLDNDPRGPFKGGNISKTEAKSNPLGINYYAVKSPKGKTFKRQWHFSKDKFDILNADGRIYWGKDGSSVPSLKIFINEARPVVPSSIIQGKGSAVTANKQLRKLFGEVIFENSKPVELIKYLLERVTEKNDLILDFFSGSGSTAHSVMELNSIDGGNRSFIVIQKSEPCPEGSLAAKVGFTNIAELGRARIIKAGKEIEASSPAFVDTGFKYYRLINL